MCRLFFIRSQTLGIINYPFIVFWRPFFWFMWLQIWVFIQSGKLSCIGKTVGVLFEHTHIRCLAWLSASKLQFLWNWPGWFECKLPLNGTSFVHTITEWMGKLIQFVVYPNKCHWYIFLNYYKICAFIKIGRLLGNLLYLKSATVCTSSASFNANDLSDGLWNTIFHVWNPEFPSARGVSDHFIRDWEFDTLGKRHVLVISHATTDTVIICSMVRNQNFLSSETITWMLPAIWKGRSTSWSRIPELASYLLFYTA